MFVNTVCLTKYDAKDYFPITDTVHQNTRHAIYSIALMLYFFTSHKIISIFYTYLPIAFTPTSCIVNGIIGMLSILLILLVLAKTRHGIWNLCNILFLSIIASYILYLLANYSDKKFLQTGTIFLHGFEQIGFILSYYLLGTI